MRIIVICTPWGILWAWSNQWEWGGRDM